MRAGGGATPTSVQLGNFVGSMNIIVNVSFLQVAPSEENHISACDSAVPHMNRSVDECLVSFIS